MPKTTTTTPNTANRINPAWDGELNLLDGVDLPSPFMVDGRSPLQHISLDGAGQLLPGSGMRSAGRLAVTPGSVNIAARVTVLESAGKQNDNTL